MPELETTEAAGPTEGLLSNMFGQQSGSHNSEDATATPDPLDTIPLQADPVELEEEVIIPVDTVDESQTEEIDPEDFEALFKAEQAKNEAHEKRSKDFQSFNDSRFNALDKRLNEMGNPAPIEKPAEEVKEYSNQELADLVYDDIEAAMLYVAKKNGMAPNQTTQQPANIQMDIQQGVQRALNPDYDEVVDLLSNTRLDTQIIQDIQNAADPAKAAYDYGKKMQANLLIAKDPEAYKNKLRLEWEAEKADEKQPQRRQGLHGVPAAQTAQTQKKKGLVGTTSGLNSFFPTQAGARKK